MSAHKSSTRTKSQNEIKQIGIFRLHHKGVFKMKYPFVFLPCLAYVLCNQIPFCEKRNFSQMSRMYRIYLCVRFVRWTVSLAKSKNDSVDDFWTMPTIVNGLLIATITKCRWRNDWWVKNRCYVFIGKFRSVAHYTLAACLVLKCDKKGSVRSNRRWTRQTQDDNEQ